MHWVIQQHDFREPGWRSLIETLQRFEVPLSARAASVALAAHGLRFDVLTDERRYLDRRSRQVGPFAPAATSGIASVHPAAA